MTAGSRQLLLPWTISDQLPAEVQTILPGAMLEPLQVFPELSLAANATDTASKLSLRSKGGLIGASDIGLRGGGGLGKETF